MSEQKIRPYLTSGLLVLVLLIPGKGLQAEAGGLTDPTAPLQRAWLDASGNDYSPGEAGQQLRGLSADFSLKSILIRGNERIAVINDERLHIGDEIGRVRVAAIEAGSVVLEDESNVRVLTLHELSIKTRIETNK